MEGRILFNIEGGGYCLIEGGRELFNVEEGGILFSLFTTSVYFFS